jgi:hypothetical protein
LADAEEENAGQHGRHSRATGEYDELSLESHAAPSPFLIESGSNTSESALD